MANFEFALQYTIKGVRPRHRNESWLSIREFISMDVPEVDSRDAPVGVILNSENATEELRYYDGRWFMKDRVDDPETNMAGEIRRIAGYGVYKDHQNKDISIDMAKSSLLDVIRFDRYDVKQINDGVERLYIDGEFRLINSNDRNDKYQELADIVENQTISIDGNLYIEVPEPVFVVNFDSDVYGYSYRRKNEHKVVVSVAFGEPSFDKDKKVFIIPIDRQDELDFVIEHLDRIERVQAEVKIAAEYHIGITKGISREASELRGEASFWLRKDTSDMMQKDRPLIYAFLDFRDAYRAAKAAEFTESSLDAISETLREYGNYEDLGPYTRMVLDRWDQRSINLDIDPDSLEDNSLKL